MGPPSERSGSKEPSSLRRPNLVSRRWLVPPSAGGASWQKRHAAPVMTGPRPVAGVRTRTNSVRPIVWRAVSSAVVPCSRSPYSLLTASRLPVLPARSVRSAEGPPQAATARVREARDRKSTRLNSSHRCISYAVFCLKKKIRTEITGNTATYADHLNKSHSKSGYPTYLIFVFAAETGDFHSFEFTNGASIQLSPDDTS